MVGLNIYVARGLTYTILLLGISTFLSCEETLPPRDLKDFLSPVFRGGSEPEVFFDVAGDTVMFGSGAFFIVGLENTSDEYLQAKARIRGSIDITSSTDPSFHRRFDFSQAHLDTLLDLLTIKPHSQFTTSVFWDLRDDSCRYPFRGLELVSVTIGRRGWLCTKDLLRFRAKGSVQFWPNVQTKTLPEVTVERRPCFGFDPRGGFENSRSCRQFPGTIQLGIFR
jgi:hypothetical protein